MSEANKGKHHTEETIMKIREAQKGEKNHMYGKKHTEESRKKMSEAQKGKRVGEKHPKFKGYYVTPFGTFSSSIDEQIKENNISYVAIIRWCKTNNDTIITKMSYAKSRYLRENFDESIIGKTYKELGFSFICKERL
jgi:hypothetical protein